MHSRQRLLFCALVIMVAVGALHALALAFHLYFTLWWYDLLTHFLGGAAVGFSTLWVLTGYTEGDGMKLSPLLVVSILAASILGVAALWELFELRFGLYTTERYGADTVLDVLLGLLGTLTAYVAARRSVAG